MGHAYAVPEEASGCLNLLAGRREPPPLENSGLNLSKRRVALSTSDLLGAPLGGNGGHSFRNSLGQARICGPIGAEHSAGPVLALQVVGKS